MSRPSSILFVTYHFPPEVGGIQTRIARYLRELRKMGIRCAVLLVTSGTQGPRFTTYEGAEVVVCSGRVRNIRSSLAAMISLVSRDRPEVVHVFTGAATLLGVAALLTAKCLRVPAVISFFGKEDFAGKSASSRALLLCASTLATAIDVNTAYTKSLVPQRYQCKTKILLGGADAPQAEGQNIDKEGRRTILFVGRLVRRKGVDDLLKAFAIVRRSSPESLLVIVGDGDQRENLVRMAGDLGISDYVKFKGSLTGQALQHEYERSDVVVLPSKSDPSDPATEGLGLTLIEASMHRKPIVGTLHGGIPEIVTHLENGLLVPAGDPEALAAAVAALVADDDFARKLGQEALNRAQSRFSWTAATSRLLTTYSRRVEP